VKKQANLDHCFIFTAATYSTVRRLHSFIRSAPLLTFVMCLQSQLLTDRHHLAGYFTSMIFVIYLYNYYIYIPCVGG